MRAGMNKQLEALRLARELESCPSISYAAHAAELRRLHELNAELLEALKEILDGEGKSFRELCEQARAAITKAEGGADRMETLTMTGFTSKRRIALDRLDDDDIQIYAQPEQELVAWAIYDKRGGSKSLHWPEQHSPDGDANMFDAVPLYTTPPKREWVGLTDEDMKDPKTHNFDFIYGARWAEAKLKEKNFD